MYSGSIEVSEKKTYEVYKIMRMLRGQGFEPHIDTMGNHILVIY